MGWLGKTTGGTQKTAVVNAWQAFNKITLNPRELSVVEILAYNESGSVTDALEIRIITTLDAGSEDWDDTPVQAFSFEPSTFQTEEKITFNVVGYHYFRVEVQSAGSTDEYTVDCNYDNDGVSA